MCGRYVAGDLNWREYVNMLRLATTPPFVDYRSYNIAPTQTVPVLRQGESATEGVLMRWGLVPFWAKGIAPKYSTINARIETIDSAASYRGPWQKGRRCILLANGFYEWHVKEDGSKQPFYIHLLDRDVFGFAGLWDVSSKEDGTAIESCTIITMDANPLMASIHNIKARMPGILKQEDHDAWLTGSATEAMQVLQQYPSDLMTAHKVGNKVNSPKNNLAGLIEPMKE